MITKSFRMTAVAALLCGVSAMAVAAVAAGTYEGTAQGKLSTVKAAVTLSQDGRITDVKLDVSGETPELGGAAAKKMAPAIVEHQSTAVDGMSGATVSSEAIRKAVAEHNRVCALIRALGDFRKEARPRITGYEFHVLTLATYVAPKYLLIDKLAETLEEVRSREPEEKAYRARIALVGSEVDDSEFIKLIEDTGAYVCADRFCFGSLPGRDPIVLTDDEDALTQVCRQYVYRGQCPRTMNMEKVYGRKQYVADIAREYHADGILYEQIKFCDPWAYERTLGSVMLRADYGFPVLSVDRPYNIRSSIGQMRTRVQAFIESMEIKKIQGGVR